MAVATASPGGLRIEPRLEEARELAREANAIPVRATFVDDCETPVSAFLKLRQAGVPSFLLESAEQGRLGRYSFLGFRPRELLRWSEGELRVWPGDSPDPTSEPISRWIADDPYAALAEHLRDYSVPGLGGLPPFAGGAVGIFGYDLVRTAEALGPPNPDPIGLPDMALIVSDALLAFDHMRHELTVIAYAVGDDGGIDEAYQRALDVIAEARELLRGPVPAAPERTEPRATPEVRSNMTQAEFEANVERIIEYIRAGDAFQVVPSQRFTARSPVDAFSIYRGLRTINPSPYMYFLDFGDFQVAGASPEPLVKVTGRRVETRPIAGTYPRGASEEEDRRQAEALLADPKERAEHLMLVDLGRHDLGRVCEYGTVKVSDFFTIEKYSHVMHIVSHVEGKLRPDLTAFDLVRAAFPAGTVSGAPKVRALEIIAELEPDARGAYAGTVGYFGFDGNMDTCLAIRTMVGRGNTFTVQAGAGIVADSNPNTEYQETVNKASAMLKAIDVAETNN